MEKSFKRLSHVLQPHEDEALSMSRNLARDGRAKTRSVYMPPKVKDLELKKDLLRIENGAHLQSLTHQKRNTISHERLPKLRNSAQSSFDKRPSANSVQVNMGSIMNSSDNNHQ